MSQAVAADRAAQGVDAGHRIGRVVSVIGPVVDIEFEKGHLPGLYNAIRIVGEVQGQPVDIVAEVEQHLGENRVRTVAMKPTDGLQRGMQAIDTGASIMMPVGSATLGRVLNKRPIRSFSASWDASERLKRAGPE